MTSNKRDLSLDFVKGFAALAVVLLHNMPNYYICSPLWIGQAVPLFLFVSAYLIYGSFEKGKSVHTYYSIGSFFNMLRRIFKPFLLVLFVQIAVYQLFARGGVNYKGVIYNGGIGPGSYYPWLYLQAWLFLPVIVCLTKRFSTTRSMLIFLSICILLEYFTSTINLNPSIYRLSFYRYIFLLYLGCLVKKNNIKFSTTLVVLAIISAIFLILCTYSGWDLRPIFFNQWTGHNWLGYFYTVFFFLVLTKLYKVFKDNSLVKCITNLGPLSYNIFLCQMFVFSFVSPDTFKFIHNEIIQYSLFVITTSLASVIPVIGYNNVKKYYRVIKKSTLPK